MLSICDRTKHKCIGSCNRTLGSCIEVSSYDLLEPVLGVEHETEEVERAL